MESDLKKLSLASQSHLLEKPLGEGKKKKEKNPQTKQKN